ncbi:hypothetical protein ACS5PU_09890 [Pedobacter sp. GSP4]|uniref:hypothetical protein n=1 Tax=Pedobacter sp. GSP4 TaxID=3453716 RepID=UPI003EEB8D4A
MKKIVVIFLYFIMCLSCRSQEKIDLEKINFAKNYKEILNNTKFQTEAREIVSTLPLAYTKDIKQYKFGTISFVNSKETSLKRSTVGVLINNTIKRLTIGIKIEIEDTSISNELLIYLKAKYKDPKVLSKVPQKNSEGKVLGNAAYCWIFKDKTFVLVQYYEYTNNKPNTSSIFYAIDNLATTSDGQKKVAPLIIKTFTP